MKKRFHEMGLVYKITMLIVCILIVPTCLIGAFYYITYTQSLYAETDKKLEESIQDVNRTVKTYLDDAQSALDDIAYSQELYYFLDEKSDISDREAGLFLESIQEQWINFRQIYPNMFSQMNIYSSNSKIKSESNWKFSIYTLQEFYNLEAAEKHPAIWYGNVQYLKNTQKTGMQGENNGALVLPVYLNVRNISTDHIVGIVELNIPFEKIIDYRTLRNEESGIKYIFSDLEGKTIYHTQKLWEQRLESLNEDLVSLVDSVKWNGEVYRILEMQNSELGIICTALIEESLIVQSARDMIWKVGVVAAAGILGMLMMTYLVIKKMLNRLIVLDLAMKQVETGNFQIQLKEDKYNDEVSRMKRRFQHMADRLQAAIDEVIEREKAQNEAELRALQAQINPHFLFNTIETMRMQCEMDRYYKVGNALMSLGEIFRYTIRWKGYEVPFYLEWKNLQNYISLMKLRLDDDFSYEMEYEESLRDITVPKMFLQPLVENSFQHGFKGVPAPWKLEIHAWAENGTMVIRILDNGCGVPEEKLLQLQEDMRHRKTAGKKEEDRQSIGIMNVLQRMDRICGVGSDISITNRVQGGIKIEVKILLEE